MHILRTMYAEKSSRAVQYVDSRVRRLLTDVHAVVDVLAHARRHLLFHHGRQHRRLLVSVQHGVHQRLSGGNDEGVAAHGGEVLLDALQFCQRYLVRYNQKNEKKGVVMIVGVIPPPSLGPLKIMRRRQRRRRRCAKLFEHAFA